MMALFWSVVKENRRRIAVFLAFCGIFSLSFALYGLPMGAVLYPAALCAAAGMVILTVRWLRLRRRHLFLTQLTLAAGDPLPQLPPAAGPLEADYQSLVQALSRQNRDLRTESAARTQDLVDYYTTWAHQIKTPIAAMRLTLEGEDTPSARQLRSQLFRVEQYVDMAMTFLRLGEGVSDYVLRECSLDGIVRGAVKKFSGEFILRRLRLDYQPLPGTVLTDEKWLSFVLEQVLSNALKYTPAGSVTIALAGEGILCIRDTGMGIAPEDLPRIFDKGYTGLRGRSDKRASGLGLWLCREICARLGHRIWAESAPDQGTAVFLDLRRPALQVE